MPKYNVQLGFKGAVFTLGAVSQANVIVEVEETASEQDILKAALEKVGTYPRSYTHKITKIFE